ncbi:MAG: YegS/Rv2252/BmrU family lipid kinase, partial [Bacteroidota bacterium]
KKQAISFRIACFFVSNFLRPIFPQMLLSSHTLFLINPGSGKRNDAVEVERLIHQIYHREEKAAQTAMIDFARLDEQIQEASKAGVKNIYAVGGDGTVNAIGARLIGTTFNFGVIPNGSGNGYARNLGYSIKTRLAIEQSLNSWAIKVDTGRFNGRSFLNVAGIGLDGEVARIFDEGGQRGFRPYVKSSAEGLRSYQAEDVILELDGLRHEFSDLYGIAIANGKQWGYDAKVAPHSSITDGLLDILVVKKFPFLKAGLVVSRLFNGKFERSKYVEVFQGKSLKIIRQREGSAQIDGEPFESKAEIQVQVLEKSLNVLLPGTLTEQKVQSL